MRSWPGSRYREESAGSLLERMAQDDRFLSVRSGGDDIDRRLAKVLDPTQVVPRLPRQLVHGLGRDGGLFPARHLDVHGLALGVMVGADRRGRHLLTVEPVRHADLDRLQAVENVQLGYAHARHAVDLERAAQGHRVQPAAAALAPGGRSKLLAAGAELVAHSV